jgi:small subunit ribosomal protein S5
MMSRLSGKRESRNTEGPQLDVRVVRTNKVFKTHKGGKTASWSILVVVGDNKGKVGVGLGKARGMLRPAAPGTGVKAGGAVRACLEAAGVHDVIAKSLGSRNAINMAYATVEAFRALNAPEDIAARRGIASAELVPWLEKARKEEADAAY